MAETDLNSDLVAELAEEFVQRYRDGERPALSEYIEKYPALADEIRDVFPALVMVENLAPENDASVFDAPRQRSGVADSIDVQRLGEYQIIREVGRGGMGIVYEAQQESLGRRVALKVLPKQLLLDPKHKKRFTREARVAANLHHTNIVPVFGVGEHEGMSYYAMQFIHGLGLDEVLVELRQMREQKGETTEAVEVQRKAVGEEVSAVAVAQSLVTGQFERTALFDSEPPEPASATPDTATGRLSDTFSLSGSVALPGQTSRSTYWQSVARIGVQVAEALEYAHDQGTLHRDIKPGNLLLDTRGAVWVTDFGLAKAEGHENVTRTGDIVGTLRYMAPEMFSGSADARSDVYALGLTLYELLSLEPAFGATDQRKLIEQATRATPARLGKLDPHIPRDLETIVHKAIDREPSHRYQTAGELAEDLHRYLADEPIRARRISPIARFGRWCKRNPAVASLTSAVAALLLAAAVVSAVAATKFDKQAADLKGALDEAEQEAAIAQAVNDFLNDDLLSQANPENQPDPNVTLRAVVDRAAEKIEDRFSGQPVVEAAIRYTLAKTYEALGDYDVAKKHVARALQLRTQHLGADDANTIETGQFAAWILNKQGDYRASRRRLEALLPRARRALGPEDPVTLKVMYGLANVMLEQGDYAAAEQLSRQTLDIRRRTLGDEHPHTLNSMDNLASVYRVRGRYDKTEELLRQTLDIYRRRLGDEHPSTLGTMNNLVCVYFDQGRYEEAEDLHRQTFEILRRALGDEHPQTIASMTNLAEAYRAQGRYDEARELRRKAFEIQRRTLGEEHPATLMSMNDLALIDDAQGHYDEAEQLHRRTLECRRRTLGDEHPETLMSMHNLACVHAARGRHGEAEDLHRRTLEIFRRTLGDEHPHTLASMTGLATVYRAQGRYDEAEDLHRRTLEIRRRTLGDEHPHTLNSMNNLANVYLDQGRYDEAEELHRQTLDIRRRTLGDEHPDTLMSMHNLARVHARQGRYDKAEELHRQTLELQRPTLGDEHPDTLNSMKFLAGVYTAQGRHDKAEDLRRRTLDIQRRMFGDEHPHTLNSMNNLAVNCLHQGRHDEAKELLRRTLEIRRRTLGDEHPDTLGSMWNLAILCRKQQRYDEAEALLKEHIETTCQARGEESQLAINGRDHLAIVYGEQGRLDEQEALVRENLAIKIRALGREHSDTRCSMRLLAEICVKKAETHAEAEDWPAALECLAPILELQADFKAWRALTAVQLYLSDTAGYRQACQAAWKQFAESDELSVRANLATFCALAPQSGVDADQLVALASQLVAEKTDDVDLLAKGMAEYRAGKFAEALATLPTTGGERALPISLLFRAMTHHQLGDHQAARQQYRRALEEIDRWTPTPSTGPELNEHSPARWVLWLRHQVVRREAEALLGPIAEQEETPQDE